MYKLIEYKPKPEPWNKGKLTGQKPPFKPQQIWAIRVRLQIDENLRDLALFNLAIDSKLRGCDLVKLRVSDIAQGGRALCRAQVIQQKTKRPVQFEITGEARQALDHWIAKIGLEQSDYLFPSRIKESRHITTRQYARIVGHWVSAIGLDPDAYGTHSLRRT
jgi:integrase